MIEDSLILNVYNRLCAYHKFPRLTKGDIGVQIGFDLSSKNLTTDVLNMHHRVGTQGRVIAIDPDISNIGKMRSIVEGHNMSVELVHCGTGDHQYEAEFQFAKRAAHNIFSQYGSRQDVTRIETVSIKTLTTIIQELNAEAKRIKHINISNNGAEYDTLVGAIELFSQIDDLTVTVISGRNDHLGIIEGEKDFVRAARLLRSEGFETKFVRPADLFWWGVVQRFLVKRKWVYGKNRNEYFGVIIAQKGRHINQFQSYA